MAAYAQKKAIILTLLLIFILLLIPITVITVFTGCANKQDDNGIDNGKDNGIDNGTRSDGTEPDVTSESTATAATTATAEAETTDIHPAIMEVTVHNARELIRELKPYRTIRLLPGGDYDIHSRSERTDYFKSDNSGRASFYNLHNANIIGEGGTDDPVDFITASEDATVLVFHNSSNISIKNLRIGHKTQFSCLANALGFYDCSNMTVEYCDIFGCGVIGIEAVGCEGIKISDSVVRDCQMYLMQLGSVKDAVFERTVFSTNNKSIITGSCHDITFVSCIFKGDSEYPVPAASIYGHPEGTIGYELNNKRAAYISEYHDNTLDITYKDDLFVRTALLERFKRLKQSLSSVLQKDPGFVDTYIENNTLVISIKCSLPEQHININNSYDMLKLLLGRKDILRDPIWWSSVKFCIISKENRNSASFMFSQEYMQSMSEVPALDKFDGNAVIESYAMDTKPESFFGQGKGSITAQEAIRTAEGLFQDIKPLEGMFQDVYGMADLHNRIVYSGTQVIDGTAKHNIKLQCEIVFQGDDSRHTSKYDFAALQIDAATGKITDTFGSETYIVAKPDTKLLDIIRKLTEKPLAKLDGAKSYIGSLSNVILLKDTDDVKIFKIQLFGEDFSYVPALITIMKDNDNDKDNDNWVIQSIQRMSQA